MIIGMSRRISNFMLFNVIGKKRVLLLFICIFLILRFDQQKTRQSSTSTENDDENIYSFWIDFFTDAIQSNSDLVEDQELPASIPILICDNYEKHDGTTLKNVYVESHLQLNFFTGDDPETLVIRTLEKQQQNEKNTNLVRTIEMDSIRSITDVKRDNRSVFLYAHENAESFVSVEVQIFFSSPQRRTAFDTKMSKYRIHSNLPDTEQKFDLIFDRDQQEQRTALGQGTYGRVYVAHDRSTMKKFAVKEIPMRNPVYTDVLENEIKILSTLNHRNIVTYYGSLIDRTKKQPVFQIIMEYVDGGSLSQHLAKFGQFQEPVIRNYTKQLLEGLQYLHENHILHRDIKSANILVNSRGEIKIADFGTSKRLAGLQLCTEDSVGTLQYMSPDVVLVPPMGYGPEVDIWSVGCTVIEMATGKMPFHKVLNSSALLLKLGSERQPPEIPSELSDICKDFISKCFEPTDKRPSAKDLLYHPFFKVKTPLPRQISGPNGEKISENFEISVTDSSSSIQRTVSEEEGVLEPSRIFNEQPSLDDGRRAELANILRDNESRENLLGQWMDLIDEKNETEILTIEKLRVLLSAICKYLETLSPEVLKAALNEICDMSTMHSDARTDLERSFYFFIKATNSVLAEKSNLPPHVLFALDNAIRRVTEHLVGLIRPDFIPAVSNMSSYATNDNTSLSPASGRPMRFDAIEPSSNDEITRLHLKYARLIQTNRDLLFQLIGVEETMTTTLEKLLDEQNQNLTTTTTMSQIVGKFFPLTNSSSETPTAMGNRSSQPGPFQRMAESQQLLAIEKEHDELLKSLLNNRSRLNQCLQTHKQQ